MEHVRSFVEAKASRGLSNKRVALPIYEKRFATCTSCPHLVKDEGNAWCGACKCPRNMGDTHMLPRQEGDYTKLHHPRLHCPVRNAGFSNYFDRIFVYGTRRDQNAFMKSLKHTDLMPLPRRGAPTLSKTLQGLGRLTEKLKYERVLIVNPALEQAGDFPDQMLKLPPSFDFMWCSPEGDAFALTKELITPWQLMSLRDEFDADMMKGAVDILGIHVHYAELFNGT